MADLIKDAQEELVRIEGLKKYFSTPRGPLHAVDDVTMSFMKGKTMGVVGESGCGKSTLGRTIIHLQESTDGKIFYQGEAVKYQFIRHAHGSF